jgi:hypothetical protein
MEGIQNNSGQNLGIAALITAIITFVLAVIPCVGLIAVIPGIIAIILASVGLSQAARINSARGLLLAGLIIAIIAVMISFSQIYIAGKIARGAGKLPGEIQNVINNVQDNVVKDMDDNDISVKVEKDGNKVEITTHSKSGDKEKTLEELEGDTTKGKSPAAANPDSLKKSNVTHARKR